MRPDRRPKPSRLTAWRRNTIDGRVHYCLFRRDLRGAIHSQTLAVDAGEEARHVAKALRVVRRNLKAAVDELDLARMGVTR